MKVYLGITNNGGNPQDFDDRRELFIRTFGVKIENLLFYVESEAAFSELQKEALNFRLSVIRKNVNNPLEIPSIVVSEINWKPFLIGGGVAAGLLLLLRSRKKG